MKDSEIKDELLIARDNFIELVRDDLIGPGSEFNVPDKEHELISSNPISRYSVGVLFPQGIKNGQDNDERIEISNEETNELSENIGEVESEDNKEKKLHNYSDDEDNGMDEEVEMSSQFKQSSMGLTFVVDNNVNEINGTISFAMYRKSTILDCKVCYEPENVESYEVPSALQNIVEYDKKNKLLILKRSLSLKEIIDIKERDVLPEKEAWDLLNRLYKLADYCKVGYVRVPYNDISFSAKFIESNYTDGEIDSKVKDTPVRIKALKTVIDDSRTAITVMLLNNIEAEYAEPNQCIFQPIINIKTEDNKFKFVDNNSVDDISGYDQEEQSLLLLYRNKQNYGTGLGVSVGWKIDNGEGTIWTDFFPVSEIPSMDFNLPENSLISNHELSMKYLSDLNDIDKDIKLESLSKLVETYENWINTIETQIKNLDVKFSKVAMGNIADCKKACDRMKEGIVTLAEDDNAFGAFQLANRAMFMQRVQIQMQRDLSDEDRYPEDEEVEKRLREMNYFDLADENTRWRPFQIAFMLMDINSIVDDKSIDRDLVDLIWFPTGGGKTEAYLGLTAFTIFYRRMTYPETAGGTAVMMRYTLRLLASQQFTRASTLICACEYIRRDCQNKKSKYPKYYLGKEEISIGLWIGGSHIPNKNEGSKNSAKFFLDKLKESDAASLKSNKDRYNKFQVLKCPWCGTKMVRDAKDKKMIGNWGYNMKNNKHFYMFCPHEECEFTDKLPIQIIDEELYDNPPTLLFGTVDKFAMMAWEEKVGGFFAAQSDNRTPDLIIQDELHLISGALGTMVGLYETAIDKLCSLKGIKPKVIASTATIRRAKEQCSVLYNRDVVQFPAPGIDASDSFFSREATIDYVNRVFGRKYVGIMPSGKTKAMMEIRAMSSMLQRTKMMDLPDQVKDKLWTLTVYFNSLKDLGKASTMVEDDVKDFIIRIANRMFAQRRCIVGSDELTSRVSTIELNETLDKLEKTEFSQENISKKKYASDVLLATNMISVGIDVARLNTMLILGQPKLTSEYIQASSRVGRSYPGVAFIQYDATKSRDRSHYEKFKAYHESYYRFVEPTGATPFSKPARERALHAVLLSILRAKLSIGADGKAGYFDRKIFASEINEVEEYIISRIKEIDTRADNDLENDYDEIKNELDEFIDYWQELVADCEKEGEKKTLYYGRKFMVSPPTEKEARVIKQYNADGKDYARETLTSMRNVDSSVTGDVIIWGEQNGN